MTQRSYEINPAGAITVGSVGEPGHRVFYIQARKPGAAVTLLAEKSQVQMLALGILQLLAEIDEKYATESGPTGIDPRDLELHLPLESDFRVARMQLAYDSSTDMVELAAEEMVEEEDPETGAPTASDSPSVARLYATRAQMRAMADHALELVASGRPTCPLCGQPDDPRGHVCPRRNGHPRTASAT